MVRVESAAAALAFWLGANLRLYSQSLFLEFPSATAAAAAPIISICTDAIVETLGEPGKKRVLEHTRSLTFRPLCLSLSLTAKRRRHRQFRPLFPSLSPSSLYISKLAKSLPYCTLGFNHQNANTAAAHTLCTCPLQLLLLLEYLFAFFLSLSLDVMHY